MKIHWKEKVLFARMPKWLYRLEMQDFYHYVMQNRAFFIDKRVSVNFYGFEQVELMTDDRAGLFFIGFRPWAKAIFFALLPQNLDDLRQMERTFYRFGQFEYKIFGFTFILKK